MATKKTVRAALHRTSPTARVKSAKSAAHKTVAKKTRKTPPPPAKKKADKKKAFIPNTNVVPDALDLRDRPYTPSVMLIPAELLAPSVSIPVLNQKNTSACTGFALASVIFHLLYRKAQKEMAAKTGGRLEDQKPKVDAVSPFMIYSMARRYDEFPGSPNVDSGSSLRGAMKGWYKYGACSSRLWKSLAVPVPSDDVADDWWQNAVKRPLGAYYRVDHRSVADMQSALNEIGVLYASAVVHSGWMEGIRAHQDPVVQWWEIPQRKRVPTDGAHAFAIVGYTRDGFIVHNSWDADWGTDGLAILTYQDWVDNAMDCWVAQLGVPTQLHMAIAQATTLRTNKSGQVQLASDETLRNREIGPYIVDMENNGRLSNTGDFRTLDSDVTWLLNDQIGKVRDEWKLKDSDPIDVAIYAHGGLTSEKNAANTAANWIPAMYSKQIFPIFLMWETDLLSTIKDIWSDIQSKQPPAAGLGLDSIKDKFRHWWDERLEKLLSVPGTKVWGEMKQNADAISSAADSGGMKLYAASKDSKWFRDKTKVRLHLVGHSAGSIVHSYIIKRLAGWNFQTVNFMAPAVTNDLFLANVQSSIQSGRVRQYNQFELTDEMELKDPTCQPILGYSQSLLYLVSRSFEKGMLTPILGMEKYFPKETAALSNVNIFKSPGGSSKSTTHGGFDDDPTTRDKILSLIKA
jgi:hypothetical protein